ncbi:hypothetical protein SHAL103562_00080 [Shewanella algae]
MQADDLEWLLCQQKGRGKTALNTTGLFAGSFGPVAGIVHMGQ